MDVKTESKHRADINEPVALFELGTTAGHITSTQDARQNAVNKVKFEVNRDQLGEFLGKLEQVQKKMDEFNI